MSSAALPKPEAPPDLAWVAVVPVKHLARAKSRLEAPVPGTRPALARAFASDTVAALRAVTAVRVLVVVSDDDEVRTALSGPDVVLVDEPVDGGLNAAAWAGIDWARRRHPDAAVAVVPADLPALRPQDVDTVLMLASRHQVAVVADSEGTGTTVLTALPGTPLRPRFGPDSLRRHVADGAVAVSTPDLVRATRDVDTAYHLAEAVRLGVGTETTRVLEGCG